jgi:hypothetical protein
VSAVCSIQLSSEDYVCHVLFSVKQADIIHCEAVVLLSDLGLSNGTGVFSININSRGLKTIWQLT